MGKLCGFMLACITLCYQSNPINFSSNLCKKPGGVTDLAYKAELLSNTLFYRFLFCITQIIIDVKLHTL